MYLCFVSYPAIVYSGLFFIEFLVSVSLVSVPILHSLKTQKNKVSRCVHIGYKIGTIARKGLRRHV